MTRAKPDKTKGTSSLPLIPDLPDNFVLIITGPALTYKKKLVLAMEQMGFVRIPTFTTKPKTYEENDFYVRVPEEKWDQYIGDRNFICKQTINGYKYALNWSTFQTLVKIKRPLVVSLNSIGVEAFVNHLPSSMRGAFVVTVLCRDHDILHLRLAQYSRTHNHLSDAHINSMAYGLQDEHVCYEELNVNVKVMLIHDNNVEDVANNVREHITNVYLSETPEIGVGYNAKVN